MSYLFSTCESPAGEGGGGGTAGKLLMYSWYIKGICLILLCIVSQRKCDHFRVYVIVTSCLYPI